MDDTKLRAIADEALIDGSPWLKLSPPTVIALLDRIATLEADNARLQELHSELLYEVSQKHQGETRHETARRYIREHENRAVSWQPIENAPKSGVAFLGYEHFPDEHGDAEEDGHDIRIVFWGRHNQCWISIGNIQPTYWQPLPAPPALADQPTGDPG